MTNSVDAQAMLEAAASGDLGQLTRELERGVPLFSKDLTGNNALFASLQQGSEDVALFLMGRMAEADPSLAWIGEVARSNGFNVLHVAVVNRKLRALSALLAIQKNPLEFLGRGSTKGAGDTPVHLAAREDVTKALALLIKHCPKALELLNPSGDQTPLATAVGADKIDAAAFLLKEGADPVGSSPTRNPAWSFLSSAAMANLLGEHLDWAAVRDQTGGTVLHVLVSRGKGLRYNLLKSMLARPGCAELVHVADNAGRTPLHRALAANATTEVVDLLLGKAASWHRKDHDGLSPLDVLEQQLVGGWQVEETVVGMWRSRAREQRLEEVYEPASVERHANRL